MAASSSSSSNRQWIYDVFISFTCEDTLGDNFISRLRDALSRPGINTFNDYYFSEMAPPLSRAIEDSQISLVVFSQRYAQSTKCLNELVKIMECRETYGQVVVPLFYNVGPMVVQNQEGEFGEALKTLAYRNYSEKEATEVLFRWRTALKEAANFFGFHLINRRVEDELMKNIVDEVLTVLDKSFLSIIKFPVGLASRVKGIISFINNMERKVCLIGICGMDGLGKTIIAKAVYKQICDKFKHTSFIENFREDWGDEGRGVVDLQKQLLYDILKAKVTINSIAIGTTMIRKRLSRLRALIVLDNVTKFEQFEALFGNREWIGKGSVIIITTRNERLVELLQVDYAYKMEKMDRDESLKLFSWHAFKEASPRKDFTELSRDIVACCGGLPLVLDVLGCYLYQRTKEEWISVLSKLWTIPDDLVQEKLRISYDGLGDCSKQDIFLDICCFFIGKDRAYVTDILNGCEFRADDGIIALIERNLIKVDKNNKLGVHDLLRDMGREIIRESSERELGKRSRLWFHEDALDVLTNNTGTEVIEGLSLKLHETSKVCFNAKAFEEMKSLRLLQLDHVQLTGDYGCLSKQLRWVYWKGFPLSNIPQDFYLEDVVAISLKHSNLKIFWEHPQVLKFLKNLNLSHSKHLTCTPDFSKLPSLEKLILKDCPSLCKIHHSIGDLHNLVLINLKDCTSLNNLPKVTYKLKSVKTLILSGCWKIDKLEEDILQMESLTTLIAENTAVKQVPFSLVRSKSIGYISLSEYKGLSHNVFPSIIWSWMSPIKNPTPWGNQVPMLSSLSELRSLKLQCNTEFQVAELLDTFLGGVSGVNYDELLISSRTSQITENLLRYDLIGFGSYQEVFNTLDRSISEGLATNESSDVVLPGDNFPYWLTCAGEGHSVFFVVPEDCYHHMKGMTLCIVYSSSPENTAAECLKSVLVVNYTKHTIQIYKRETAIRFNDEDWEGLISNLGPGDQVEIFVTFGQRLAIKKTAVFVIVEIRELKY